MEKNIKPLLSSNKNILIVCSWEFTCRASIARNYSIFLIKKIVDFEIPTGNPLLIKFDENVKCERIINILIIKELKKYYLIFKIFF